MFWFPSRSVMFACYTNVFNHFQYISLNMAQIDVDMSFSNQ